MIVRTIPKSKTISIVLIDEERWGILPNRVLLRLSLSTEREIDASELQLEKLKEELEKYAWDRFLKFLAYRERSMWECNNFLNHLPLQNSISDKLIELALKYNYISDQRFAEVLVRSLCEYGKSKQEIVRKLKEKQIADELINKYLAEYYYTQEQKILAYNIKKALARYSRFPEKERKEKLKIYLFRKGFTYSDIVEALAKLEKNYE